MEIKFIRLSTGFFLTLIAVLLSAASPAIAESCTPLEVVEGNGETEITKTVTLPGFFFIESNWDTDFAVNEPYSYYVTTVISLGGNPYDVSVFLKYPDESSDAAYSTNDISLAENQPLMITTEPRAYTHPYQINLRVGGLNAEGNTYTGSVVGCR